MGFLARTGCSNRTLIGNVTLNFGGGQHDGEKSAHGVDDDRPANLSLGLGDRIAFGDPVGV